MSDYRPWDPKPVEPAPEAAPDPVPEAPTKPEATPKRFQAPPGLDEKDTVERPKTPDVAGAMLLSTGGFLLVMALVIAIVFTMIGTLMDMEGDARDADEMRAIRDASAWPAFVVGALSTAGGFGILYQQPWAKGVGIAAAVLSLPLFPFTVQSIVALATIGRPYS